MNCEATASFNRGTMRIITLLILVWLHLVLPLYAQKTKGWHGIVPLRSTRMDVERLLGASVESCQCIYKTEHEVVHISYAHGSCKDDPNTNSWDVAPDTVLLISVTPRVKLRLADLKLDLTKYQKTEDTHMPGRFYYSNDEEGIFIIVIGEDSVGNINYQPTENDQKKFRCRQCH